MERSDGEMAAEHPTVLFVLLFVVVFSPYLLLLPVIMPSRFAQPLDHPFTAGVKLEVSGFVDSPHTQPTPKP